MSFSITPSVASILVGEGILHYNNNKGAIKFYRKGPSVCATTEIFFAGGGGGWDPRRGPVSKEGDKKKIGDWPSQTPSR